MPANQTDNSATGALPAEPTEPVYAPVNVKPVGADVICEKVVWAECGNASACYHGHLHQPEAVLECKSRLCPNLRANGRRVRVRCVK